MKNKILLGIMTFVMAFFMVSCSDEDYAINTKALISDSSVHTDNCVATPTTATLNGHVDGLESQDPSAYSVGFYYGTSQDNLSSTVKGSSGATFSATITGVPGQTMYYQAFVTLQGNSDVTYKGEVKSFIFTDATAFTDSIRNKELTANSVKLYGKADKFTESSKMGIAVSCDSLTAYDGVQYEAKTDTAFNVTALGLLPNTKYYYVAYVNLGGGIVYGEIKSFTTKDKTYDADNDFVDLGLSTKWAKCNLGAETESDLGGLFGFGDMYGFNTSIDPTKYASADTYKTAQDVAYKAYGGKATLPTIDEIQELFDCCQVQWMAVDGVNGYKFTGPNGNSIFMPAAGSRVGGSTTGVATEGRYMTGSVNATDTRYAESFLFTNGGHARVTTPTYQALSVRPVTVAKNVPFKKELLCKTWEIDLTTDGAYKTFPGPSYFYGTDDSWRTITNGEPCVGDSWSWEADFAGNSWAVGGDAKNCQGSITFNEDGTCVVKHIAADGTETDETGTYTVDEEKKEITLSGCKVLAPANYTDSYVQSLTDNIRILSLTESSLQLMVIRKESPCGLSINMVPQLEKYGYQVSMMCMCDWANWDTATMTIPGGQTGTYTIVYNTSDARTNGMVFDVDINGFAAAYPNAFVRVDKIEADGVEVPFDANKFCYGNIEGAGNFRLELFNIWGATGKDSPFDPNGGDKSGSGESALAFSKTFAVTFTVVSLDADLNFVAKQTAIGLDAGWSMPGNWGKENPGAIKVVKENNQYKLASTDDVALTMDYPSDCNPAPSNGAVNLVDIVGIRSFFNGFSCELKSVVNDGSNVAFDASKLKYGDIEGNGNFRVELHNIWGSGTAADPAFGGAVSVENNNCVTSLGFSYRSVYTIGNFSTDLFQKPW